MTAWITSVAVLFSLLCLLRLLHTDPKRRRGFELAGYEGITFRGISWLLVFTPGIVLLFSFQTAAFVMWLGITPLLGWLLSLRTPKT